MVDNIVVIFNSEISEQGSHNKAFAQFLGTYLQEKDSNDDDDEECMCCYLHIVWHYSSCSNVVAVLVALVVVDNNANDIAINKMYVVVFRLHFLCICNCTYTPCLKKTTMM